MLRYDEDERMRGGDEDGEKVGKGSVMSS